MKQLAISGLLLLLLAGCAHEKRDKVWPFVSETCPVKGKLIRGLTKCTMVGDVMWCSNVKMVETCAPPPEKKSKGGK